MRDHDAPRRDTRPSQPGTLDGLLAHLFGHRRTGQQVKGLASEITQGGGIWQAIGNRHVAIGRLDAPAKLVRNPGQEPAVSDPLLRFDEVAADLDDRVRRDGADLFGLQIKERPLLDGQLYRTGDPVLPPE
jgi:hypothetical protein